MDTGKIDETPEFKQNNNASVGRKDNNKTLPEAGTDRARQPSEPVQMPRINVNAAVTSTLSLFQKANALLKALSFDPLLPTRTLERFIVWVRTILTPELFDRISIKFVKIGHSMLVATAGMSLLFWIIAAIKQSSGIYLLFGLGFFALFLVLQYTAHKFLNAGRILVLATRSQLGSAAFPDCIALLFGIAGTAIFIHFLTFEDWNHFWAGLAFWFICDLIAYVALNPIMLNITISTDAGAGEEAIGIISFFVKAFMRIVPIAYGAGVTLGFILCFSETCILIKEGANESRASDVLTAAAVYGCLPFISYIVFVFYHLAIDLLKSLLVLPSKLDRIIDKRKENGE